METTSHKETPEIPGTIVDVVYFELEDPIFRDVNIIELLDVIKTCNN